MQDYPPQTRANHAERLYGPVGGEWKIPVSHLVVLLLFPVGLVCSLIFYWPLGALGALPVFAVAWLVAGVSSGYLCKGMGRQAILPVLLIFLLGHAVALGAAKEHISVYQMLLTGTDDLFYARAASRVARAVRQEPSSPQQAIDAVPKTPYIGYALLLGYVYVLLPDSDSVRFGAAVSINLAAVSLIFSSLIFLAQSLGPLERKAILFVTLTTLPELLNFASEVRKDCIVVALFMLMTLLLYRVVAERSVLSFVLAVLPALMLWNLRAPYVVVVAATVPLWLISTRRPDKLPVVALSVAIGLTLLLYLIKDILSEQFADYLWYGGYGVASVRFVTPGFGWGRKLYDFPVVGPFIYFMLSPIPLNPLSMVWPPAFTDILRSAGTILSLYLLYLALRGVLAGGLRRPAVVVSFVMFFSVIFIAAMGATEARHKLAAGPFLALMAYYGLRRRNEGSNAAGSPVGWPRKLIAPTESPPVRLPTSLMQRAERK